jgi:hypothetical protein
VGAGDAHEVAEPARLDERARRVQHGRARPPGQVRARAEHLRGPEGREVQHPQAPSRAAKRGTARSCRVPAQGRIGDDGVRPPGSPPTARPPCGAPLLRPSGNDCPTACRSTARPRRRARSGEARRGGRQAWPAPWEPPGPREQPQDTRQAGSGNRQRVGRPRSRSARRAVAGRRRAAPSPAQARHGWGAERAAGRSRGRGIRAPPGTDRAMGRRAQPRPRPPGPAPGGQPRRRRPGRMRCLHP